MIDLSFLTDEEQEAILKVLQRDADLKRAEEERIRHLPEKVKDDGQVKNMSGQWFYEAKSKRHRDKIHGADIIRASIRRKPLKTEPNQSRSDKTRNSWVNNVNKEVPTPPGPLSAIDEESKSSQSSRVFIATSKTLQKPEENTKGAEVSPSKQRKNPFNDSTVTEDNAKSGQPENGVARLSGGSDKDTHLPSVENHPRVNVTNHSRVEGPEQDPTEPGELQRPAGKPPVPKARKNIHKTSDVSLTSEDSFSKSSKRIKPANGQGTPPRGILKRNSSSSSTDSEVLRMNQTLDPSSKSGLPPAAILEGVAEKEASPDGELEGYSQNSLERLKQVRFSSSVSRKERPHSLELQEGKETGEFTLLDSDNIKANDNAVGDLDELQRGASPPAKLPQSPFPALNGNVEDGGVSQEEETAPGSYGTHSSDLPSDPSPSIQSPNVEPILPSKTSSKVLPSPGEEQTVDIQVKTKHLSPEPDRVSKSTSGQQLPQAPQVGSADPEQGKPALVEGQSAKTTPKPDKHAAEVLKAADESISKVLDWFERSSSSDGTETVLLSPQEKQLEEEMEVPKPRVLPRDDDRLSTIVFNQDSSTREIETPSNKDYNFHKIINQPHPVSFAKNGGSPRSLLVREQKDWSQSRPEEVRGSGNLGQDVHPSVKTQIQSIDKGTDKTNGRFMGDEPKTEMENPSRRELDAFRDKNMKLGLKKVDSPVKATKGKNDTPAYADGERNVKSPWEEYQPEKFEGKRSEFLDGETMQPTNRNNPFLVQEQELRQSSLMEDKKRIKDIRAFWEGEKATPKATNKEDLVNESKTVSKTILDDKKESNRTKPMSGSSGYVTGESDNEQSKYSIVTFRKVELSDSDSEPKNNDFRLSSGKLKPNPIDNSKRSHLVDVSARKLPSEQKNNEFVEQMGGENLHLRDNKVSFSKDHGGGLQGGDQQQNPHFKIHSLKEKIDEESKAEMLSPSQFQNLRSFWGAGVKPVSGADVGKVKPVTPRSRNSSTESYQRESDEIKEVNAENSQAVWEGKQQKTILREKRVEEPNAKVSPQNVLETSRAFSEEVEQPDMSPLIDVGPNGSLDRKVGFTSSEVVETVNRTLVPSKFDADAFNVNLERLLREVSDVKTSSTHPVMVDVSEQAVSLPEKSRFFNKMMELSHGGQNKSGLGPQRTEGVVQKHDLPKGQAFESKTSTGNLPTAMEKLGSVHKRASNMEEGRIHQDYIPSRKEAFQIPSPKRILPDASLAAQKSAVSPAEEVSETVTGVKAPSTRKCNNLNTKLIFLLKESTETPSISPATEHLLKSQIDNLPKENQPRYFEKVAEKTVPASPQMVSPPLQDSTIEASGKNTDTREDGTIGFAVVPSEPTKEVNILLPSTNQKNVEAERYAIDSQAEDVTETVANTVKSNPYDPAAFRANLRKLLEEHSEDKAVLQSTNAPLFSSQSMQSIFGKDGTHRQEIIETVEKATAPSRSRQVGYQVNFQTLLKEDSEILPNNQKNIDVNTVVQSEREPNQDVDLVCQEVNESVHRTVVPPKLKQGEFNSGFQKLLEEQMPLVQLGCLDDKIKASIQASRGLESMDRPQEADETVVKSTVPVKDDAIFKAILGKLLSESSDVASQSSVEVPDDSASQLESSSVKMPTSSESSNYRTEVKIPLKGKSFKQDSQTGIPERIMVFQKTVQVNIASTGDQLVEKGEGPPTNSQTNEGEKYERKREERVSRTSASLDDGNEIVTVMPGSQRSSTPLLQYEHSPETSKMELFGAHPNADESEEDARSFRSDHSDENGNSFVRIQRSRIRSEEGLNPVMDALQRSSNKQAPSKSLEDIPSATSNKGNVNLPRGDLVLSAEDVSTAPSFPDNKFSHPEKVKQMSKSVPAFTQDESDDRETDTASDSSYPLGRIKKSPSSLTNLSGSSGLASLSSVSTSVMSVYSGDFGNVDVKGNIQFAIDYVDQLKEFHIFIAQGKDLAIADVKKQRSDPYVKSYLLPEKYKLGKRKTTVKKKTLNPVYNEILRYKVEKDLLATQRLNISVWHNDTFGRNSFLGEVELDLRNWDWHDKQNKQMNWYPLKPRTPLTALELENRGEVKIALQYIPQPAAGKKTPATGEVHIWVKECNDLPVLRGNKLNSFVKCTILPDTSRKSRQKTRAVSKTTNPVFNHTMVYDGFRPEDLKEACVELTVWDHNKLANHFIGGLRIGLGTGKSYGTPVDWMDSTLEESNLWERMIDTPNTWAEDTLPLRMLMTTKMTK